MTGTHGLIRGAEEHFLASRKVDDAEHLKPYRKLPVDITVSRSGRDKALGFANELFNALESAGHLVSSRRQMHESFPGKGGNGPSPGKTGGSRLPGGCSLWRG